MKFSKFIFLTAINTIFASTIFGAQQSNSSDDSQAQLPWALTHHDIGPNTVNALNKTGEDLKSVGKSLEETAKTLKTTIHEIVPQIEKSTQALKNVPTKNYIQGIGFVTCCAGIIRIATTGELDKTSTVLVTSGATMLFNARTIGDMVD